MFSQSISLLFPALLCFNLLSVQVAGKAGSLMFKTRGGKEHVVSSTNCSGVFFKTAALTLEYERACITGVWGFYEQFCKKPVALIGGHNYCFGLNFTKKLVQVALFGNARDPFESSISHFQKENFVQLTVTISENEYQEHNNLEVDALGSWITVTNSKWTLYGDGGQAICLRPTVSGRKVFCTYNSRLLLELESMEWNNVIRVEKGCLSNVTVKADACYPFRRPNDKTNCKKPPMLTPCPDPENKTDTNRPHSYCVEDNNITTTSTTMTIKPTHSTTTPAPAPTPLCGEMTREVVKRYWLDPVNNQCAKSFNEAVLTDQLRRFAATRFDRVFDERLQSLDQMKQLVIHSRDIMKKTCIDDYVPMEFFDVATEAFLMFINEDFFYGVEGIDQISLDRVMSSLKTCWKRAKAFVYESKPLGCDLKKITGSLILPAEKFDITIPENAKSKRFEPLIETAWKIFLNAHSYCFEDFQISNDHHHFSVLFLELFSKTIYEKWIEPLANKELYKFILPKFDVMKEIMENIDYCVAATGHVSQCPVWILRSNPLAKPILESLDVPSPPDALNNKGDSATSTNTNPIARRKRSTWVRGIDNEKISIWDGSAYCVRNMIDPSRLGLATCTEAF